MDAVTIIRTKRDGGELSDAQIEWFLETYTRGDLAEEQASALLMAIFFRGMTERELATWTETMIASGERLTLTGIGRPTVDKHSTGGVGDKVSLVLCPLVAACGAAVPQLSGRGLGHTGGTLDKMESIPGWQASLSTEAMVSQLRSVGAVICAAGSGLAPTDRKLYALRDVTGTVESIPLIASSIMSKKIAEGTGSLVLNVTTGSGAFMREEADARQLAETMVGIGERAGVRTVAVLSTMDQPLGRTVGNALEVVESVDVLRGGGPLDVQTITLALAREMLSLAGLDADPAAVLGAGGALGVWDEMVRAQGGDPSAPLPVARHRHVVSADRSGVVRRLDAFGVGVAAWRLGAGRARKEDPVSATAGVVCEAKVGDNVEADQPVLELHYDDPGRLETALEALNGAIEIGSEPVESRPLVLGVIRA